MQPEDSEAVAKVNSLINKVIDDAIESEQIRESLGVATDNDEEDDEADETYAAVILSLRQGAQNALATEFAMANSENIAYYLQAIKEKDELLIVHLASSKEYQTICSLEEEVTAQAKLKQESLDQLKTRQILARAAEAASIPNAESGIEEMRSRNGLFRFSRKLVFTKPESEQLGLQYQEILEELQLLRRRIADVATERRRYELTVENQVPELRQQAKKTDGGLFTDRFRTFIK